MAYTNKQDELDAQAEAVAQAKEDEANRQLEEADRARYEAENELDKAEEIRASSGDATGLNIF